MSAKKVRICGICGLEYEVDKEEYHSNYHNEYEGQKLPKFVVNSILYFVNRILRTVDYNTEDAAVKEEIDKACWTLMHMWYHQESEDYKNTYTKEEIFKQYKEELIRRYPQLRKWETIYV